jgi:hypothetical protein
MKDFLKQFFEKIKAGKKNAIIALILVLFIIKGILLIFLVPFWHLPDEASCMSYIEILANERRVLAHGEPFPEDIKASLDEKFQRELQAREKAQKQMTPQELQQQLLLQQQLQQQMFSGQGPLPPEQAGFSPFYYSISAIIFFLTKPFGLTAQVIFLRFLSLIFGAAIILLAFSIAKSVFPDEFFIQIFMPVLLLINPVFSVYTASVVIDNLLILLFGLLLYQSIVIIKYSLTLNRGIFLAATLVVGLLTKPKFLLVLPLVAFVLIFDFCRRKNITLDKFGHFMHPGRLLFAGVLLIILYMAWPVLNTLFLRQLSSIPYTGLSPSFTQFLFGQGFLERVSQQFWGYIGYLSPWDFEFNILLKVFTPIALFGFIVMVIKTILSIWQKIEVHGEVVALSEEEGQEGKKVQDSKKGKTRQISVSFSTLAENIEEIIGKNWPIWILLVLALFISFYMTAARDFLGSWGGVLEAARGAKGRYIFLSMIPGALFLTLGVKALLPEKKPETPTAGNQP